MKHLLLLFFSAVTFLVAQAQLNLQWQNLGPDNLGGPVRGLILDNRDSTRQTLYAGIMGGGVWKSSDGANTWHYLGCTDNYAVSCISQGVDGTIFIGTGDGFEQPFGTNTDWGHRGNGIYQLDSADNIVHLAPTTATGADSIWRTVNRIAFNPIDPAQIIAANEGGLYRSNNSGFSWSRINLPAWQSSNAVNDVKWSRDGLKIFADLGGVAGSNSLIRSVDGGHTWSVVDTLQPGHLLPSLGRIEIAISPGSSDIVYISLASPSGYFLGIYKTADAGNTWDTVAMERPGFNPFNENFGWYDNAIAVSPSDSGKIYFGGTSMYTYSPSTGVHQLPDFIYPNAVAGYLQYQFLYVVNDLNPDEVYVATDKGVFKSTNAFSDFTAAQFSDHNAGLNARDFLSVAADKNGRVIGGSDFAAGLLIGNTYNHDFTNLNYGFGDCYFSRLDTNYAFIENYYAGVSQSADNLNSFTSALDSIIDPMMLGGVSACGGQPVEYDAAFIAPMLLHETKTAFATNDSVTYTATSTQNAGNTVNVTSAMAQTIFPFVLPVTLSTGDSIRVPDPVKSRLFLASSCGVWMKEHAISGIGSDWYHIANAQANCFAANANGNKVYWGSTLGDVQSLTDLNLHHYGNHNMLDSFQITSATVAGTRKIQSICIDPKNDSILMITIGGFDAQPNIYKSTDAGTTWEPKQVGPTGSPAYSCLIDANNSNNYIVGTERGIWTSSDSGATWQQDNANMCDVPVYQVRQIPLLSDDCCVLYAATNSRGLWRSYTLTPAGCNTSVGISQPVNGVNDFKLYPNPATSFSTVEFTLTEPQQVTIQVHDITGRLVQTQQQFLFGNNQKVELNTSTLTAGTYLVSVETGQGLKTKLLVVTE